MHKTALPLFFACTVALPLAQESDPSFNCSKASHEAEVLICKDAELASLDRSLADLISI